MGKSTLFPEESYIMAKNERIVMGKLIIDGNSVFEIDEECVNRRKPSPQCDIEKYLVLEDISLEQQDKKEKNGG